MKNHLELISRTLETFTTKYENILLLGEFYVCVADETMKKFCSSYGLHSLIQQPIFYFCIKNTFSQNAVKSY